MCTCRLDVPGVLSSDILNVGGLTATVTFAEMKTRNLDGCGVVDGIMGMGLPEDDGSRSVFQDLVVVRPRRLVVTQTYLICSFSLVAVPYFASRIPE